VVGEVGVSGGGLWVLRVSVVLVALWRTEIRNLPLRRTDRRQSEVLLVEVTSMIAVGLIWDIPGDPPG
jgi:hypothetical protein